MEIQSIVDKCATAIITMLKEDYGLKGDKLTYGNLDKDEGSSIQIVIKAPKGKMELGTIRLQYYALGAIFPAFFGGIKDHTELRQKVDRLKLWAERQHT